MGQSFDIEEIRAQCDFVAVAERYTQLTERTIGDWWGLSPFTSERTPSFHVMARDGYFKCFSTGKGGDLFTFVQEVEGITFQEALLFLADLAGLHIEAEAKTGISREDLRHALRWAADQYQSRYNEQNYSALRGISVETADRFGLGYAPESWDFLASSVPTDGFRAALLKLGVLKQKGDRIYDFLRGRLVLPIRNSMGEVVALTGRLITGDGEAKYLGTPESRLYAKRRTLFGLDTARKAIRASGRVIIVEGQLDLLTMRAHGYEAVVAPCGTALTTEQIDILARQGVGEVYLWLDDDAPGRKAMHRAVGLLLASGLDVKVALGEPEWGRDPDEVLQRGFRPTFVSYPAYAAAWAKRSPSSRDWWLRTLRTLAGGLPDPLVMAAFRKEIGEAFELPEWSTAVSYKGAPIQTADPEAPRITAEDMVVRAILEGEESAYRVLEQVGLDVFEGDARRVAEIVADRLINEESLAPPRAAWLDRELAEYAASILHLEMPDIDRAVRHLIRTRLLAMRAEASPEELKIIHENMKMVEA